jgi:hypothetical protein
LLSQELFEFFCSHTLLFMAVLPIRHGGGRRSRVKRCLPILGVWP